MSTASDNKLFICFIPKNELQATCKRLQELQQATPKLQPQQQQPLTPIAELSCSSAGSGPSKSTISASATPQNGVRLSPEPKPSPPFAAIAAVPPITMAQSPATGPQPSGAATPVSQPCVININTFRASLTEALSCVPSVAGIRWMDDVDGKGYQLSFVCHTDLEQPLLSFLSDCGLSTEFGRIDVVPVDYSIVKPSEITQYSLYDDSRSASESIKQLVTQVEAASALSFDFIMLVVVAGSLAGIGLCTNNVVVIVASMLVSPLMCPILSGTVGVALLDGPMIRRNVTTELLSLLLCIVIGFIVGACFAPFADYYDWPTSEMSSRGDATSLLVGAAIAFPSGIGVALGTLGNNVSGLVGVAISASLLPPAVNTGILFAYAALGESVSDKSVDHQQVINKALISFLLTVVNIICIFFAAILMFKIKEIAPIPGKTALFKHDIKHARQLLHSLVTETSAQEQQPVSTVVHATLPLPQLIQRHRRSRTGESPISPAYSKTQLAFQRPGELLAFGGTFSANDRRWGPAPINIMLSSAYSTTHDLRQAQRPHIVSIFDKPGAGGGGMTASNDMSNNTTISNNNTGGVGGNLKGNVQLNVKTNEQL